MFPFTKHSEKNICDGILGNSLAFPDYTKILSTRKEKNLVFKRTRLIVFEVYYIQSVTKVEIQLFFLFFIYSLLAKTEFSAVK